MVVLNLEPFGYSDRAKNKWNELGCTYLESSWEEVRKQSHDKVEIIIVRLEREINDDVLQYFPSLKFVLSPTTGLDHINIASLEKRFVKLISLRGETNFLKTIPSTPEHTWGLLLSLIRNIPNAINDVRQGNWNRDRFRGYQLKGKKLGIIGMGRTGKQVAQYAHAFEMEVHFFDPYIEDDVPFIRCGSLKELVQKADIVSIHVHLSGETERMIDAEVLAHAKKGSYWVNTSRGGIWDEQAVMASLHKGQLNGIATDVLSTELADIKSSPLWMAQQEGMNVIITPHIGGASWDAMWSCEEFLADKMEGLLR